MTDLDFMRHCFRLARLGQGSVSPNPMVACVIVQDNQIIGEGYHRQYGQPHAEVNALQSVKEIEKLPKSTLYVNLEPCSHYGQTPPCVDLIIAHKIPKVVISCTDPNPKVNGMGIARLREAGIEVITGVLEEEGRELNRRFFTMIEKNRPYIILKWAQSADGFMDVDRTNGNHPRESFRISDEYVRAWDHLWRSKEDAIWVGSHTIMVDNPRLNVRAVKGRNPLRITVDRRGRIASDAYFFDASQKSLYFTSSDHAKNFTENENLKLCLLPPDADLSFVLSFLREKKIASVIVEGGYGLHKSFLEQDLWDEARIITSPLIIGNGLLAPKLSFLPKRECFLGKQKIAFYRHGA